MCVGASDNVIDTRLSNRTRRSQSYYLEHRVAPKREIPGEIKTHTHADHGCSHAGGSGKPLSPNGLRAKRVAFVIGLSDYRMRSGLLLRLTIVPRLAGLGFFFVKDRTHKA